MLAVTHGRLLTVTQGIIEDGTVLIDNGVITAIGTDIPVPEDTTIIDASGKWVTPGLIDAHTHISTFNEPHFMPHMGDGNETSAVTTPQVRAIDALNPFDIAIPAARSAGFTTCYTGPGSANVIGGTGLSFKLKSASTVREMALEGSEMMKMALGENPKRCYGSRKQIPTTRMGTGAVLRKALFDALQYSEALKKGEKITRDFDKEALVPVVRGEMRCRIHSHRADDIVTAIRIAEEFHLDYVIEHCTEGYKILDYLKEKKTKVVIGPLLMGPEKFEIWGTRQDTPAVFEKAGVTDFALMADDSSATKWLPSQIGICMRMGLSFEQALRSVTINPARILKLDHRIGSLEVGKDADLAIFNGMPFSNLTWCEQVIIDGKVEYVRQEGDL